MSGSGSGGRLARRRLAAGRPAVFLLGVVLSAFVAYAGPASPALGAQEPGDPPGEVARAWEEVASWLTGEMEARGVVGGSLYLTYRGEVVRRLHHGTADLDRDRPVEGGTIYHWASITKTLTAVALMQLRDRGLLSLDDPVVRHLPELRGVHNPYGPMEAVTLRMLLSHSAGFRSPTWPWAGGEAWHPHEPTRWEQLVAMIPYTRIHFEPGSRFQYSNPGIVFLGRIIEGLTGEDIEVYLEKNVLRPLGMESAYFDHTPYHLLHRRSNNYVVEDGVPRPNGLDFDTGITVSNGGLNASVPDLARWLHFLLGYGPGVEGWPGAPDGVLARGSLEEMWRPVVPVDEEAGRREWMGLSFFVLERDGRRYVGHTGSQKAYRSFFYIDPESGAGVVGAFNTVGSGDEPPDTDALRVELRERLFEEVLGRF